MVGNILLTPKASIHVGCWNVWSLGNPTKQNGRLHDVLRTMKEKAVEILALSEVRWPGHGMSQLEEVVIAYSGMAVSGRQHRRHGVALIFTETAATARRAAGLVFDPVSERIIRVRLKLHTGFVSHCGICPNK